MKSQLFDKFVLAIAILLAVSVATSATEIAGVGKGSSVYFDDAGGSPQAIVSGQIVASVPLPNGYNSKKDFLLIRTTVGETCPAASVSSAVTVGGLSTTDGMVFTDCVAGNGGFSTYTRTWQLLPEKAGGPPISQGSTVDLTLFSGGVSPSNAQRTFVNVQVEFTR